MWYVVFFISFRCLRLSRSSLSCFLSCEIGRSFHGHPRVAQNRLSSGEGKTEHVSSEKEQESSAIKATRQSRDGGRAVVTKCPLPSQSKVKDFSLEAMLPLKVLIMDIMRSLDTTTKL